MLGRGGACVIRNDEVVGSIPISGTTFTLKAASKGRLFCWVTFPKLETGHSNFRERYLGNSPRLDICRRGMDGLIFDKTALNDVHSCSWIPRNSTKGSEFVVRLPMLSNGPDAEPDAAPDPAGT